MKSLNWSMKKFFKLVCITVKSLASLQSHLACVRQVWISGSKAPTSDIIDRCCCATRRGRQVSRAADLEWVELVEMNRFKNRWNGNRGAEREVK